MSVWSATGNAVSNQPLHLMPQSVAVDTSHGNVLAHTGLSVMAYRIASFPALVGAGSSYLYPLDFTYEEPSPRLLPHGRAVLTCQQHMLVAFDLEAQRATVLAPAACEIVAVAGDASRVLLRSAVGNALEYPCYDTAKAQHCYKRWSSTARGPAALSLDGRQAILSGGDQLFEVIRFDA
jgi:hypothetical protein